MTISPALASSLRNRQALKVISGLANRNVEHVCGIAKAAEQGGATFVDIAADVDLIAQVRRITQLPICVSAVDADQFVAAVGAGADLIEIGNFDSFYARGQQFSADDVLAITQQTRDCLPDIMLSVTVPHILPLDQQCALAEQLVAAGADVIQTEGGTSSTPHSAGTLGLIEKAAPTLAAAHAISRAVEVPVLCASGLSSVTVPLAIAAGASGVGVGTAISQLNSPVAMVAAVCSLVEALQLAAIPTSS